MLATSQEFINGLLDHLPQKLQLIAEIAVYFALLTALMMVPLVLWLGYAVASAKKREQAAS
jgi:hypothetical protein